MRNKKLLFLLTVFLGVNSFAFSKVDVLTKDLDDQEVVNFAYSIHKYFAHSVIEECGTFYKIVDENFDARRQADQYSLMLNMPDYTFPVVQDALEKYKKMADDKKLVSIGLTSEGLAVKLASAFLYIFNFYSKFKYYLENVHLIG